MRIATLAALAVCAALLRSAAGSAQALPLTLQSMNENVSIRDPQLSPDGERIVVAANRSGSNALWIMDRDGGNARPLLTGSVDGSSPVWSPDGRSVASVRSVGGQSDIWVTQVATGAARQVTNDAGGERSLAWAPDGRRIAFLSDREKSYDVYVADLDDGRVEKLTSETNPWDEFRWAPEWSPDGRSIVYVSNRSEEYADDLWLVDVASKRTEKLTARLHVMTSPVWSPDGRHIAFNGLAESEFWYGDMSDVYVVEMPAKRVRKVEMNTYVSDRNGGIGMGWSADSRNIFFRYLWQGDSNLWSVPVEGGVATQMTYETGELGNFSVGRDGRSIVYVRSTPTRGGEVHRFDLAGGPPVQLTRWVKPYAGVTEPRKVSFRAKDGKYILGYLYVPPDFDPMRSYPSLVEVHGGGNNAYGNGFHPLEHFLSHNGYVVLAIEYRGSAGHGREFQELSIGDWAADQGWDAVAAAEYLRAQTYSNGKVGIYGGSYGGIMTLAALTRDASPFAAAAPLYGIYDWEDAYTHGDRLMKFWIIEGHHGFRPGENAAVYAHTATIQRLHLIPATLPFLVIHGELDRRAPFQQSQRLVAALRERGHPVEFYSYPDEQHGFRLPKNRVHAYGRLLAFFDQHLHGPGQRTQSVRR